MSSNKSNDRYEGRADDPFLDDMINPTIDVEATLYEDNGEDNDKSIESISDDDSTNEEDGGPRLSPDAVELIENEID